MVDNRAINIVISLRFYNKTNKPSETAEVIQFCR